MLRKIWIIGTVRDVISGWNQCILLLKNSNHCCQNCDAIHLAIIFMDRLTFFDAEYWKSNLILYAPDIFCQFALLSFKKGIYIYQYLIFLFNVLSTFSMPMTWNKIAVSKAFSYAPLSWVILDGMHFWIVSKDTWDMQFLLYS